MSTPATTGVEIRRWRPSDEAGVLALLDLTLTQSPAPRTPALFRWKHLDNPSGPSIMLVAESEGTIVGFRAFMRWRFETAVPGTAEGAWRTIETGGLAVPAARAIDTATHPEHQRRGIFRQLTQTALPLVAAEARLIFNTPNHRSLPGYRTMGWQVVQRVPALVRVQRPARFASRLGSLRGAAAATRPRPPAGSPAAHEVLAGDELAGLLGEVRPSPGRLTTPRDLAYLRWRYGEGSGLDYRAVVAEGGSGMAVYRVRLRGGLWEAAVSELLVPPGQGRTARRLLRAVAAAAGADHLSCSFPAGTWASQAALRCGFLPVPGGPTLVVKPLTEELEPDPRARRAWGLTLGDLEVF